MMTSREVVKRTIRFEGADRLPYDLSPAYGTDFAGTGANPSPDARPPSGADEWGAVWHNIGICKLGEVREFPLKTWDALTKIKIPDIREPRRWRDVQTARARHGSKFLYGYGFSLYERVHFVRGLENTWADIYENSDELKHLVDILADMNIYAIEMYAMNDVDGIIWCDDWGLQNQLMISPAAWREIWKPRYARVYEAAHKAGLLTFLHSCGYIVEILDDLIEAGLDVIQMDQQENMGLDLLGKRFGGRITFFSPVDIQNTMAHGSMDDIRRYCRAMVEKLGRPKGGFIPRWYSDPVGTGHRPEAVDAMCQEFLKLSRDHAGRQK